MVIWRWIRILRSSNRRITYFITSEGLREKGRIVKDYIAHSLTFFRHIKNQWSAIFIECPYKGWHPIALIGNSELADIAKLVAFQIGTNATVEKSITNLSKYNTILITDIIAPQMIDEVLKELRDPKKSLNLRPSTYFEEKVFTGTPRMKKILSILIEFSEQWIKHVTSHGWYRSHIKVMLFRPKACIAYELRLWDVNNC